MPTDYILFNHGVDTREKSPRPDYASPLFELIRQCYPPGTERTPKKIALYWGDVVTSLEQTLLETYQTAHIWQDLWFQDFREKQIMQFIGDGALYLSRYCSAKVAEALLREAKQGLSNYNAAEDRVHIVTHSMGTIILFDILFSARWDEKVPGHDCVRMIRDMIYGVPPHPDEGILIGSISTMGSPIGFFSLTDVNKSMQDAKDSAGNIICTHDITPRLQLFLAHLHQRLGEKKLPWYNFVHPGDPVAYPLEKLLPQLVDEQSNYIEVRDILVNLTTLSDYCAALVRKKFFAVMHTRGAHHSYWQSTQVAKQIYNAIQDAG